MPSFDENDFIPDSIGEDQTYWSLYQNKKSLGQVTEKISHHSGKLDLFQQCKTNNLVVKVVHDNNLTLSRKNKETLYGICGDGMDMYPNLTYSLNKQKRWLMLNDPKKILDMAEDFNEIESFVVEQKHRDIFSHFWYCYRMYYFENVVAVHTKRSKSEGDLPNLELDEVRTAKTKGRGQKVRHFLPENREDSVKHPRGPTRDRPAKPKRAPCAAYYFLSPYENPDVLAGRNFKYRAYWLKGSAPYVRRLENWKGAKENIFQELKGYDDIEEPIFESEGPSTSALPTTYRLEDYFVDKFVHVKNRKKRNNKREVDDNQTHNEEAKAGKPIDFVSVLDAPYIFQTFELPIPKGFDYAKGVEELRVSKDFDVVVLAENLVTVDASRKARMSANEDVDSYKTFINIIRQDDILRVQLNTVVQPRGVNRETMLNKISTLDSLLGLVENMASVVCRWTTTSRNSKNWPFKVLKSHKEIAMILRQRLELEKSEKRKPSKVDEPAQSCWLNSKLFAKAADAIKWVEMVRLARAAQHEDVDAVWQLVAADVGSNQMCLKCNDEKNALRFVTNCGVRCDGCLAADLRRDLRAGKLPSRIQVEGANLLDVMPMILPLAQVNLYVRLLARKTFKEGGLRGSFFECPSCGSDLYEDGQNQFGGTSCSTCSYSWCWACQLEPHWPMSCEQFALWRVTWQIQCAYEHSLEGTEPESTATYYCECSKKRRRGGRYFTVYAEADWAKCPQCELVFFPKTMQALGYVVDQNPNDLLTYNGSKPLVIKERQFSPRSVTRKPIEKPFIRSTIAQHCAEARKARFSKKSQETLRRACAKFFHQTRNEWIARVPDLSMTILQLVENALGWVYIERMHASRLEHDLVKLLHEHNHIVDAALRNRLDAKRIKAAEQKVGELIDFISEFIYT